ncbi:MAG: hypothetical protein LBO05_04510 [Deltaproteobacteria bacterium]|nr:hypothetical protein [Deltaproteobacteria bacterium]
MSSAIFARDALGAVGSIEYALVFAGLIGEDLASAKSFWTSSMTAASSTDDILGIPSSASDTTGSAGLTEDTSGTAGSDADKAGSADLA